MLAHYNTLLLYCPSCGIPTRLNHADYILRAAMASGRVLMEYSKKYDWLYIEDRSVSSAYSEKTNNNCASFIFN
jgi:hypothetical protein